MIGATHQFSFSGHETFPFRYPWLKKGYDAVSDDGHIFTRDDAITTLGVGKNMVRSIRHWCLSAGIIEPDDQGNGEFKPTKLGRAIFADNGLDPYLEDPGTVWLLHWQIASNRHRSTTWFWAFSHYNEPEFTRDTLASALTKWTDTLGGKKVASSSLRRDVEVFLRTYLPSRNSRREVAEDSLDCPLVELELIAVDDAGHFSFRRGVQASLPDAILLFATLKYWDALANAPQTLSIADLGRLPGSPGRLFKIDESSLIDRYAAIEAQTEGAISYNDTAGLKQLYRRKRIAPLEALKSAYALGGRKR